jgi:hypothetical protein
MKKGLQLLFVSAILISVLILHSCNDKQAETNIQISVDSSYFAMNPMDISFDTAEMTMIHAAMGEYIEAFREYRDIE